MKKQLIIAAVAAVGGISTFGFAKDKPVPPAIPAAAAGAATPAAAPQSGAPRTAEKALRDYYGPTAQFKVVRETDVNGVKVVDAVVTRDGGEAQASVTATGHYITTGLPQTLAAITPGAQETAQIFKTPPQSISQEEFHGFWVVVSAGANKIFIVQFDAAGRIRNIESPEQMREDNPSAAQKVSGPTEQQIRELAEKRFPPAKVDAVITAKHDPGYYQVGLQNQHGHGWAILNPQGDVTEWRLAIDRRDLPVPVREAIDRDLKGDKILRINRGAERVYRLDENVGGEELIMLVKPDGAVAWTNTRSLHPKKQ